MQVTSLGKLEKSYIIIARYLFVNKGSNDMIGVEGCKQIRQAEWRNLILLNLGAVYIIKSGITLVLKDGWKYVRMS